MAPQRKRFIELRWPDGVSRASRDSAHWRAAHEGRTSTWPASIDAPARPLRSTICCTVTRGSPFGATRVAIAHSVSPGCTVTVVAPAPGAAGAGLADDGTTPTTNI